MLTNRSAPLTHHNLKRVNIPHLHTKANYTKLILQAARLITFTTLLITAKQQLKYAIKISLKILRSFKLSNRLRRIFSNIDNKNKDNAQSVFLNEESFQEK